MKDFSTAITENDLALGGGVLVEAGAGTGKTYNIQSAYLRLVVCEGLRVRNILVVTFTEAATAELRERLRAILAEAAATLINDDHRAAKAQDPETAARTAPFLRLPVRGAQNKKRAGWSDDDERRLRVSRALQDFDNAAILTIHGFCKRVLDQHAFECGADPDAEILPDTAEALATLCHDWWRRNTYGDPDASRALTLPFENFTELLKTVNEAAKRPLANLQPAMPPAERDKAVECFMTALLSALKKLPNAEGTNKDARKIEAAAQEVLRLHHERPSLPARRLFQAAFPIAAWIAERLQRDAKDDEEARWKAPANAAENAPAVGEKKDGKKGQKKITWRERFGCAAAIEAADTKAAVIATDTVEATADTAARVIPSEKNEIVREILDQLHADLRKRRVITYDAMLTQVRDALRHAKSGGQLRRSLREEYHAALVDEFQDTDPVQEEIFRTLFGDENPAAAPPPPFLRVGDPKQAIYGFRGGDIFTYYAADRATPAARRFELGTNYRSAPALVAAVNAFFANNPNRPDAPAFANKHIAFNPLESVETKPEKRLTFPAAASDGERREDPAPFKVWLFTQPEDADAKTDKTAAKTPKAALRRAILARVTQEISTLLAPAADANAAAPRIGNRPLNAGDIAILVLTNNEAADYRAALLALGIPSTCSSAENVFDTLAARRFALLMRALLDPARLEALRSANVCGLFAPLPLERLVPLFQGAAAMWLRHGFLRAYTHVADATALREHTAASGDGDPGERVATLDQLAALANAAAASRRAPDELHRWFARQLKPETRDRGDDESFHVQVGADGDAVRILTVHKSKGLEFPVVFAPSLWDRDAKVGGKHYVAWHSDPGAGGGGKVGNAEEAEGDAGDGIIRLDICKGNPDAHVEESIRESFEENIRLIYVALTRAINRVYLPIVIPEGDNAARAWSANVPPRATDGSPMHPQPAPTPRRETAFPPVPPSTPALPLNSKSALLYLAQRITAPLVPQIEVSALDAGADANVDAAAPPASGARNAIAAAPEPSAANSADALRLAGTPLVDKRATHTSFTALAARAHAAAPLADDSENDTADVDAAASDANDIDADADGVLAPPSPPPPDIFLFPAGAATGDCWHEIFQKLDFQAAPAERAALADEVLRRHGLCDPAHPNRLRAVCEMIDRALATPLPPFPAPAAAVSSTDIPAPPQPFTLAQIPAVARLHELAFDLTLNDSAAPLASVAELLEEHWPDATAADNDDATAAFLHELRRNPTAFPTGWLTGTIDLLFEHEGRFHIADWKSNRIAARPRPEDFAPPSIAREMARHAYPLQALLYTLATHVWLRQTLHDYDYDCHFGGVYYVFLRGLDGTPGRGIHVSRPPRALILALEKRLLP